MSEQPKPVAWAVIGDDYEYATLLAEHAVAVAEEEGGRVVPLYRSPTLTDEERYAIDTAMHCCRIVAGPMKLNLKADEAAATLRRLLERLA